MYMKQTISYSHTSSGSLNFPKGGIPMDPCRRIRRTAVVYRQSGQWSMSPQLWL